MKDEWPIWRLWLTGRATLTALETTWSLDDVSRANSCLDIEECIKETLMPKVKKG